MKNLKCILLVVGTLFLNGSREPSEETYALCHHEQNSWGLFQLVTSKKTYGIKKIAKFSNETQCENQAAKLNL